MRPRAAPQRSAREERRAAAPATVGKPCPPARLLARAPAEATAASRTHLPPWTSEVAVTPKVAYSTIFPVFGRISRKEGLATAYHGFTPTALGGAVYTRLSTLTYQTLRARTEFGGRPQPRPSGRTMAEACSHCGPRTGWTPSDGVGRLQASRDTCPPPSPAAVREEGAMRGPSTGSRPRPPWASASPPSTSCSGTCRTRGPGDQPLLTQGAGLQPAVDH